MLLPPDPYAASGPISRHFPIHTIAKDVARSSLERQGEEVQSSHDPEKPTLKEMLASFRFNTQLSTEHAEADTEEGGNKSRYPDRRAKKAAKKKLMVSKQVNLLFHKQTPPNSSSNYIFSLRAWHQPFS